MKRLLLVTTFVCAAAWTAEAMEKLKMKNYYSIKKHSWLVVIMTTLVLAGMSSTAKAAFFNNTTGLTSPDTILTFEEIILVPFGPPHGTAGDDPVLTSQYAAYGVNFTGFYYYNDNDDTTFNTQFPAIYSYDPAGPGGLNHDISIMFSSSVSEAALAIGSIDAPANTTFGAYLVGVLQDSGTFPTSLGNPDNYYGFTGIVFDELRINTPTGVLQADNLQFSVLLPSLPGDYSENGVVDAADYTVWRDYFGQFFGLANENPAATTEGFVDTEDYDYWRSHFGATGGSGAGIAAAVPEPTSALLTALVGLAAAIPIRRRS